MSDGVLTPAMSDALLARRDRNRMSAQQQKVAEFEAKLKRLASTAYRLELPAGMMTDCDVERWIPVPYLRVFRRTKPFRTPCGKAFTVAIDHNRYGETHLAMLSNGNIFCSGVGVVDGILKVAMTPSEFVRDFDPDSQFLALEAMVEHLELLIRDYA